jgi:hypothetical protein
VSSCPSFCKLNHFSDDEYVHLPDVHTVEGLLDLISGCTLVILGNVVDFRTYCAPNQTEDDPTTAEQHRLWKEFDRNDILGDERMAMCYARGMALCVFEWIRGWCVVRNPEGGVIHDLPSKHVVQIMDALLAYKAKAEVGRLEGAPHCTLWMLKAQILNLVEWDSAIKKVWNDRTGAPSNSLRMTLDEGCKVGWRTDAPYKFCKDSKCFSLTLLAIATHNVSSEIPSASRHDGLRS